MVFSFVSVFIMDLIRGTKFWGLSGVEVSGFCSWLGIPLTICHSMSIVFELIRRSTNVAEVELGVQVLTLGLKL